MEVFEQKVEGWIAELLRAGVTRELLWQEYRAVYPDVYGYSQFCEHLSRHVARRDLTVALDHTPGEVLLVDFAGKKMTCCQEGGKAAYNMHRPRRKYPHHWCHRLRQIIPRLCAGASGLRFRLSNPLLQPQPTQ
jgi:hypothetical protein